MQWKEYSWTSVDNTRIWRHQKVRNPKWWARSLCYLKSVALEGVVMPSRQNLMASHIPCLKSPKRHSAAFNMKDALEVTFKILFRFWLFFRLIESPITLSAQQPCYTCTWQALPLIIVNYYQTQVFALSCGSSRFESRRNWHNFTWRAF